MPLRTTYKAIELDPDFAEVYNNRGTAYSDRSEYKRAIEDYNKAIDLKPEELPKLIPIAGSLTTVRVILTLPLWTIARR